MEDLPDEERSAHVADDAAEVAADVARDDRSSHSRSERHANPVKGSLGLSPGLLEGIAATVRRQEVLIAGSLNTLNNASLTARRQEALLAPTLRNLRAIKHLQRSVVEPALLPGMIALVQQAVKINEQTNRILDSGLVASVLNIEKALSESLRRVTAWLPTREQIERLALPPNLRPSEVFYDPDVYATWIDEGLPIAYVLDGDIVNALAAAETSQQRRRLIGRRRERIIDECEALLEGVAAAHVQPFIENARLAISGLRAGHHQLAQTWAAANLESLVKEFNGQQWSAMLDEKQPAPKLFRAFFFVGQVRVLMRRVNERAVPRELNRHASVHYNHGAAAVLQAERHAGDRSPRQRDLQLRRGRTGGDGAASVSPA